ncbi:hypothetical protein [Actinoplanes xinjiangensis]|uniref:Uncharacterized protein n=1 Tax=Actinoplanes xinjiangensis TaxID=512350 RepID=A0A316FU07_9ACTN|nr:hypothetical protein [Actinoplanes xinjiangensis]PWK51565.1 hypothetical protein BC793_102598 [Actinoplanes xinjiangensis]
MTVNDQLTSDAPRDPWAAGADEPTTATEIITAADRPDKSAETVAPMIEGPVAGTTVAGTTTSGAPGGPLPPAGPPTAVWEAPPPAASRPGRSPKVVLIAAVLVTAIASSGITAGVMSAIGGGTPAVATQDGSTGRQGGPGGFGGGPRGGMPGDQDSGTTQQDSGTTQQDPGTTPEQDTTTQEGTTGT